MGTIELSKPFHFVWRIANFSAYKFMPEPFSLTSTEFICCSARKFNLIFHPDSYYVLLTASSKYYSDYSRRVEEYKFDFQLQIGDHMTEKKSCSQRSETGSVAIKIDFKTIIMYHTYNDWLTIKLSIWSIKTSSLNISQCYGYSRLQTDRFQLSWKIEDFSSCTAASSKLFTIPKIGDFQISLNISNDHIYVTVSMVSNFSCVNKLFQIEIIVLGLERRKWKSEPRFHVFKTSDEAVKFHLPMKISDLMSGKFLFGKSNELLLCCNFAASERKFISEIKCYKSHELEFSDQVSNLAAFGLNADENFSPLEFSQYDDKNLNCAVADQDIATVSRVNIKLETNIGNQCVNENINIDLCGDLQRMYMDRKLTDVVFQVGDKTLPAHKFVLAARSPVFMAMFEQDMLENRSGIIAVSDIDYNTLDLMLLFMYGGKLQDMSYENAIKLLVASHKYQIVSLQGHCSTILRSMMAFDTICEIIVYSDMAENVELKESAVEYFKANAKCIVQSAEWKQLLENNLKLAAEVLTEYAMTK